MSTTTTPPDLVAGTFFASLRPAERAELEALAARKKFPRGAMLMFEQEPDERVAVLLRGRAKVARLDRNGRELVLDIADPGDVLGELAFVDKQPRIASVTALEPVEALLMGSEAFHAYVSKRPELALALTEVMARRFRVAQLKRSQFTALDTMGRLAARLVELAERYGVATESGVEVQMPISHEELAAWTGASRAGVSQALQSLRELGWVELARRKLLVRDLGALRSRGE
jgi:CRP/FNR family transcriptional regulator, cyclic AMP receptor protein